MYLRSQLSILLPINKHTQKSCFSHSVTDRTPICSIFYPSSAPGKLYILGKTIKGHYFKIACQSNDSIVSLQYKGFLSKAEATSHHLLVLLKVCWWKTKPGKSGELLCNFSKGKRKIIGNSKVIKIENETVTKIGINFCHYNEEKWKGLHTFALDQIKYQTHSIS